MSWYVIGVDVGHTLVKAAVFDSGGRTVGTGVAAATPVSRHPSWQEHDMQAGWLLVAAAIRRAVAASGVGASSIRAVGVSAHGDGLYLVDEAGRPVRPAILATDARAAGHARHWRDGPDADFLLDRTGQLPAAYSPPALAAWLRDHEPESLRRTRWILQCKDWIRLQLTGIVATDPTDASAGFADRHDGRWSRDCLAVYGLADIASKLPDIVASAAPAGVVTAAASGATGLAVGTVVAIGCHDVHAAALGVDALGDGAISCVMGTFNINQVATRRPAVSPRWQLRRSVVPGTHLQMSTSPAGSSAVDWVRTVTGLADADADVGSSVERALEYPTAPTDPFFLPFVHGGPMDPPVEGAFIGLTAGVSADVLLRVALEGVAFTHRLHLDVLGGDDPDFAGRPLRLTGGGSRSPAWTQLLSDVTGFVVEVTDTEHAGARGAAILAATSAGLLRSVDGGSTWVSVVRTHRPDPERHAELDLRHRRWTTLIAALQGVGAPTPTPAATHRVRS